MIKRTVTLLLLSTASIFAQSTVSMGGMTYAVKSHPRTLFDGPGGVLDARIKDPDGPGPQVAPKASTDNPAWVALKTAVAAVLPKYSIIQNQFAMRDGNNALQLATYWYADNSQTAAHDAALYMLRHIEYFVPLICVENAEDCSGPKGYGLPSWGISYWMPNWIMTYELMRSEMTTAERQLFASKMLNDNSLWGGIDGNPSVSCTNGTANSGANVTLGFRTWSVAAGSVTSVSISLNAQISVTIQGTTAGMAVGDLVRTSSQTEPAMGGTFPILSIDGPNSFSFGYTQTLPNGDHLAANPNLVVTHLVTYATTSAPVFGTLVTEGSFLYTPSNAGDLGVVSHIFDATHALVPGGIQPIDSEAMYTVPREWSPGQCGFVWVAKHYSWTPRVMSFSSGATIYPPDGGQNGLDAGHNLVYSTAWGLTMIYLSVLDDDVNMSVRSGPEFTAVSNFWLANPYMIAEKFWTGFHQTGSGYGLWRAQQFMPGTAMAIESSLVNGPDLLGGVWAKNAMVLDYVNAFPGGPSGQMEWGQPDVSGAQMSATNLIGFVMMAYWFRNSPEGNYANWFLQHLWTFTAAGFATPPGSNLGFTASNIGASGAWFFIFTDQNYPTAPLSGAPTSYPLNISDTGLDGQRADALISRTGFTSITDTLLNFHSQAVPEWDHNVFAGQPSNYGSYKIFKGHYLLAEDFNIDFSNTAVSGFTIGGTASNYVEIGGTESDVNPSEPVSSAMPRATGTANFAYGMADVTAAYLAGAGLQHGYRHLTDFKKPGTQQFIVDYMDFQTASGQMKRAYYHYPNKATTVLVGDTVTLTNPNATLTQLITKVMSPQPVHIASDTSGTSYRLDVCVAAIAGGPCDTTNQSGEMLVIHMPAVGNNNTLPGITTPSAMDANFAGIEIDGASPKVALFPRKGKTYTATSFTASHTGTAQILISGITPTSRSNKVYTLVLNGTPVLQHQAAAADTTIYFEGPAGSYQLVAETAPPKVNQVSLGPGNQYRNYLATMSATGGSGNLTWSVLSGTLPAGLSLDSGSGTISGIATGSGTSSFALAVTDALGQADSIQLSIGITAAAPLLITTTSLGDGVVERSYSHTLAASGGGGTFVWSLSPGSALPEGLTLSSSGLISGLPAVEGPSQFQVTASDAFGNTAVEPLSIMVHLLPATNLSNVLISGATSLR